MKFKHLFLFVVIAATVAACNGNNSANEHSHSHDGEEAHDHSHDVEAVVHSISTDASLVDWKGSMIGVYAHTGSLKFQKGELKMAGDKILGGGFVVDMNTMVTTDDDALYAGGGTREDLINHLGADDFFAVKDFPEANFEITSADGNELFGNLTIRGNTHEETVKNVMITKEDGMIKASGTLTFDRQKYNVSYESSMKDMVLSDDIDLEINLVINQ